jgi:hypothetical protein
VSLDQLLARAAATRAFGAQVILATSEPPEQLEPMLTPIDVNYVRIDGKLLKPL